MNGLVIQSAPAEEPTTLEEVKRHLRIDHDDENFLLEAMVTASVAEVERATGKTLISTEFDWNFTTFTNPIYLPKPPLVSVTHIQYQDKDDVTQTVPSAVYEVDTTHEPGVIRLDYDQAWPTDVRGHTKDISIRFVAGYADAASVPQEYKAMIWDITKRKYDLYLGNPEGPTPWAQRAMKWRLRTFG